MSLSIPEKIGAVLAFIPGFSTITGLIKVVVYRKQTKPDSKKNNEMTQTAGKTATLGEEVIYVDPDIRTCEENLKKYAIWEMVPGLNIAAAILGFRELGQLSKLREVNNSEENRNKYLFQNYGISPLGNAEKILRTLHQVTAQETDQTARKDLIKDLVNNFTIQLPNDPAKAEKEENEILETKVKEMKEKYETKLKSNLPEITKKNFEVKINILKNIQTQFETIKEQEKLSIFPEESREKMKSILKIMESVKLENQEEQQFWKNEINELATSFCNDGWWNKEDYENDSQRFSEFLQNKINTVNKDLNETPKQNTVQRKFLLKVKFTFTHAKAQIDNQNPKK